MFYIDYIEIMNEHACVNPAGPETFACLICVSRLAAAYIAQMQLPHIVCIAASESCGLC